MRLESVERINQLWDTEQHRRKNKLYPNDFPLLPEIPLARYYHEDFFEIEKKHLWTKTWLLVGHADEVPEAGCYKRINIVGTSAFFTRKKDGNINAFYNTCQHRGAQLLQENTGKKSSFVCPYHAWNYNLDGELKFVPDEADFPCLNKGDRKLKKIRCETLGKLIFICFDDSAKPLDEFLGAVKYMIDDIPWGKIRLYKTFDFEVPCNWKFIHDAFSETYHVQYVHEASVNQALNRIFTARQMFRNGHNAMVVKNRVAESGTQSNVLDRASSGETEEFTPTVQLNPVTKEGQRSYNIFPNVTMPVAENLSTIMVMSPQASDQTIVRLYYIKIDPASPIDTLADRDTVTVFNAVLDEDFNALSGIQSAARNNSLPSATLGYGEQFIYNYQHEIDNIIGEDNIPLELQVAEVNLPYAD